MNEVTQPVNSLRERRYKGVIILLLLVIIGLVIALLQQSKSTVVRIEQKVKENLTLQTELDSLMSEHDVIKLEYGSLTDSLTAKDSMIIANAEEIKKLIASQADYYRIRKKLDLLRKTTQGYLSQIDSLYTENRVLTEKNVVLTEKYEQQVTISQELEKTKVELEDKVTQAAVLKAYNIVSEGLRVRGEDSEKLTFKARRVDAVKVCFTLSENPVAQPGMRTVYVRIARPDNVIVTQGKDDAFSFEHQGQKLNFSMKQEVNYQNKAMNVCLKWDKQSDEPAMKGVYKVYIFTDGYEIGYSQFTLE